MKKFFLKHRGFTLVELMVVIAIIGILVATLYINITGYFARARDMQKRLEIGQIHAALTQYYIDNGDYNVNNMLSKYANTQGHLVRWINLTSSPNIHPTFLEDLENLGYLQKNKIRLIHSPDGGWMKNIKSKILCQKTPMFIDGYMLIVTPDGQKYILWASLEYPKQSEEENLKHSYTFYVNGISYNICTWYGRNYWFESM